MRKVLVDLTNTINRDEIHEALKEAFDFPAYYGENLDALYDLLTEISDDTFVCVLYPLILTEEELEEMADLFDDDDAPFGDFDDDDDFEDYEDGFEDYLDRLRDTIADAENDNPSLHVMQIGSPY